MKKYILCGLAGALAMLLVQHPVNTHAMGSGMMGSGGYRGYEMGPGMMRYGGYQDYGMGPRMMNPSDENGSQYRQNQTYLDSKAAERTFREFFPECGCQRGLCLIALDPTNEIFEIIQSSR